MRGERVKSRCIKKVQNNPAARGARDVAGTRRGSQNSQELSIVRDLEQGEKVLISWCK